ncbi:hypothetical protein BFW01_g549 [Lasiodiplodia theobromae]|nr:hypothetical protein BFW01_g549 [Lasiodiplodia theobromae]
MVVTLNRIATPSDGTRRCLPVAVIVPQASVRHSDRPSPASTLEKKLAAVPWRCGVAGPLRNRRALDSQLLRGQKSQQATGRSEDHQAYWGCEC